MCVGETSSDKCYAAMYYVELVEIYRVSGKNKEGTLQNFALFSFVQRRILISAVIFVCLSTKYVNKGSNSEQNKNSSLESGWFIRTVSYLIEQQTGASVDFIVERSDGTRKNYATNDVSDWAKQASKWSEWAKDFYWRFSFLSTIKHYFM